MSQCNTDADNDPRPLFQKYKKIVQKNFEDPRLDEIEEILRKRGFTIEIGEQGDTIELWQDGRMYTAFAAVFLLVDSRDNVIIESTGQILAKASADTELVVTEHDGSFLQEAGLRW